MANWSQGAQGAAGGAALGASVGGPWGAAAGGVIGGLAGAFGSSDAPNRNDLLLPGYDERRDGLNSAISGAAGVNAPQMNAAQIGQFQNAGMGGQYRQGQNQLIGQLQQQSMGQGPSLAQGQFNQNLDQGIAAQIAMANSGQGNASAAARGAAQNTGSMTQNFAGQAAQARMQEQLNARQQLAGVLGQARGQEMQGGQFNAGQQNQRTLAQAQFGQQAGMQNQNAWLQNQAQQNQYGLGLRGMELDNARYQQGGNQSFAGTQNNMLGTQIMSGGAGALANAFGRGQFA